MTEIATTNTVHDLRHRWKPHKEPAAFGRVDQNGHAAGRQYVEPQESHSSSQRIVVGHRRHRASPEKEGSHRCFSRFWQRSLGGGICGRLDWSCAATVSFSARRHKAIFFCNAVNWLGRYATPLGSR